MKAVRLHITRYICGSKLLVSNTRVSLEDGFPKHFLYMKEIIDSKDNFKIRGIMSLLYLSRAYIPTKIEESSIEPDFSSITDPYKGKKYTIPLSFIKKFVEDHKISLDIPEYDKGIHYLSSKGSPFGPATISGPYALFTMMHIYHDTLRSYIKLIGTDAYHKIYGNFMKVL